ncbi:amidohydrolase family protein [Pseudonocardia xinjiangensis]|uniref:amidohydrolase family protein n=1 Tax=Pseudonocardia xinjiangensis TaxID=75289 RepID=UPI001B7D09AD|nr:amidohydrolase family protein [Pseudonocardia xinjiangensis]
MGNEQRVPGPVVDAHLHVWDPALTSYPWLVGGPPVINRAFALDDVVPDLEAAGVDSVVLVQSADDVADTELMLECARKDARVAGVVAYAPLQDPEETGRLLDRYRSAEPVVRGIRVLVHEQPDPWWLLRDEVIEGLTALSRSGLTFDLVAVLPEHLRAALRVSELLPDLPMVLDHLGHPPLDGGGRQGEWWDLVAAVARNPRAHAKVSGLYPGGPGEPSAAVGRVRPSVEHALDVFGPARLMYGGDWPISLLHGGYPATWPLATELLSGLSRPERDDVLGGTATRFYRLDEPRR